MRHVYNCRRTFLALVGISILGAALLTGDHDTSMALAGIVAAIAGSNAYSECNLGKRLTDSKDQTEHK